MQDIINFSENILQSNGILNSFNELFDEFFGGFLLENTFQRLRYYLIKTINPPIINGVLVDETTRNYLRCLFGLVKSYFLQDKTINLKNISIERRIVYKVFLELLESDNFDHKTAFNIIIREINEHAFCVAANYRNTFDLNMYYSFYNEEFFARATNSIVQHLPRTGDNFVSKGGEIILIELKRALDGVVSGRGTGLRQKFLEDDSRITTKNSNPSVIERAGDIPVYKRLGAYQLKGAKRLEKSLVIPYQIVRKTNDSPTSDYNIDTTFSENGEVSATISYELIANINNTVLTMLRQCEYNGIKIMVPSLTDLNPETIIEKFTNKTDEIFTTRQPEWATKQLRR